MARQGVADVPEGMSFIKTDKSVFRYVDQMKDTDETVQIASASKKSEVIYLGGVSKNFIPPHNNTPPLAARVTLYAKGVGLISRPEQVGIWGGIYSADCTFKFDRGTRTSWA